MEIRNYTVTYEHLRFSLLGGSYRLWAYKSKILRKITIIDFMTL